MRSDNGIVIGVDIGGTTTRIGVLDEASIVARLRIPTDAHGGPPAVTRQLTSGIVEALRMANLSVYDVDYIVVGAPGHVDQDSGVVLDAPNLLGWQDVPLRDALQSALPLPAVIVNDAVLACLGEHQFGAGKGTQDMALMTIGTGIGGGIIAGGGLLRGACGLAGHIGHMCIDLRPDALHDSAGHSGCLEAYGSGTAIAREAATLIAQGGGGGIVAARDARMHARLADVESASSLEHEQLELLDYGVTARDVVDAALRHDQEATVIIQNAARAIGFGCVTLIHCFNPEVIVIGGGVSAAGELLFDTVIRVARANSFARGVNAVRIVPAELGDDAGLWGARAPLFQR